jgi:hypothetical protein
MGKPQRKKSVRVNACLFLGLKMANGPKNEREQNRADGGGSVQMQISRERNPAGSSMC